MPFSTSIFDAELELYFRLAPHDTVCDIGAGAGKFGRMLQSVQPPARRIAVEMDPEYVEQYRLREIYHEVLVMDAARLMDDVRRTYSAIIIGDVIEHMRKSVGVDLLNFLVYRSRIIFVKFPVQFLQGPTEEHLSEAHVSVWSESDFAGLDHVYVELEFMRLAVIRGYQNHAIEWLPEGFIQRLGYPSCRAFYDERPERWRLADWDTRWRSQCETELDAVVGADARFVMVDEERSGLMGDSRDRRIPFLERNGEYFGMPADDAQAIAEVERQRQGGARFLVLVQSSFWALEYYPGLRQHLEGRYPCRLRNDRLVVFELTP
jgi:hypothetical protein